jgi:hypothetical protein
MKMLRRSLWRSAAAVALCAMLGACSQPAPAPPQFTGPEAPFLKANAAAMDRMMAGMEVTPTGDVDRDFARMMIPHHQGGVDMAEALLQHGKNAELRTLARNIIVKQKEEIALMRRILEQTGGPAEAPPSPAPSHHHTMG